MEKEPTTPDGRTPRQPEEQSGAGAGAGGAPAEVVVGEEANGIADNRGRVMVEEVGSNGGDEDEGEGEVEEEEEQREQDVTTASARAMPVAKLTAEEEEDEEEVEDEDEDDEAPEEEGDEEAENSDDYYEFEEANDGGITEDEGMATPVTTGGAAEEGALPRIIARESRDEDEVETTGPSKDLIRELEKLDATRTRQEPRQEEYKPPAVSATAEDEPEDASPPALEEDMGEATSVKDEPQTPAIEEVVKVDEPETPATEDAVKADEPETPATEETLKADEPETAEVPVTQEVSKDGPERAASSSLLYELEKLNASRPQSAIPEDVQTKERNAEEISTPDAPESADEVPTENVQDSSMSSPHASQDAPKPQESSSDVPERAASSSLLYELEKMNASRAQSAAPENAPAEEENAEVSAPSAPEEADEVATEKESSLESLGTSQEPDESAAEKESEESTPEVLNAPEAPMEIATQRSPGSATGEDVFEDSQEDHPVEEEDEGVSGAQPLMVSEDKPAEDETTPLAVAPSVFEQSAIDNVGPEESKQDAETVPEAATEGVAAKEEEGPVFSRDLKQLPKEVTEDPAVVPSPAKLYTALKAVDTDTPIVESETLDAKEVTDEEVKAPISATEEAVGVPLAANGDSDADVEDEDDEEDDEDDDEDDEGEIDMDSAKVLAELTNTVGKSDNGAGNANKPSLGAAGPSLPQRPTVRKAAGTAIEPVARVQRSNGAAATQLATTATEESTNGDGNDGNDETREKLQNIRVKFLRLAHRLGQSPQNVVVAQVLYRLGLAEQLRGGRTASRAGAFSFDRASALAEEQEATGQDEELDFACTILLLGKTGVGKSSTINSIFDERKTGTNAFSASTKKVQEIIGTVHGIKVRVIDTPGLLPSVIDQQHNERIMGSVKKYIRKTSPDIVLYFDRLDMQSRDYGDLPLLRTITDLFGAAVWFNAIVVLTHASSAPPDGPNGVPLSYEMFVAQRSHVVQQTIRQAAGDMRLMNPVSLVENHPACRTNRTGQRVLPNGQVWKPQLLLLCFASKILAEANSLLKLQDTSVPGRPFGQRPRVPPLPFLLSSLLQSRAMLKMPDDQAGDEDESDEEVEEEDSDGDDYDELPPFRPLSKEELEELSKEQKQQYFEELADREKLFQKKQWREELRRRKEMKKRAAAMSKEELSQPADEAEDEAGRAAAVPVPMPDMALPPSFDSDNPTHRYRYLETANQWLVRPVLETHGWDHDAGYDGFNVEKMFVVKEKIPASISGQFTKDKKEAQINFEAAASLKHGEGKVSLTGFDVQTIGKDLAYTLRGETRFNNFRKNKTTAGLTFTLLGDTIAAGLKLEDRLIVGKRLKMVVNGGVLTGKGDKAFGGSLEATLRGKDYPLSRTLTTLGLSVMDWHGDLAIGGNLQSQFMVGKTMMVARGNLNNRGAGQISLRASSSEQLQMVLIGIIPILRSLINTRFGTQPSQ